MQFPTRAFVTILVSTAAGVGLGLLVGLLMGSMAPDFGLALLGRSYDPVGRAYSGQQIGIGLGIANGVWVGLLAGIAIVIAEAIKSLKKS